MTKKEKYYIEAIKNLIKKNNFLSLDLDDEEWKYECENNAEKYVINLKPLKNSDDIKIIIKIVEELGIEDYSINEIAELFGIDHRNFEKIMKDNEN